MEHKTSRTGDIFLNNTSLHVIVFVCTIIFISNLNAIVDNFLHPEIPYFDQEHMIVGGITGLVSTGLFGLIMLYARYFQKAMSEVRVLRSILPICSHCKKIRASDSTGSGNEHWQSIESYITEHTDTMFSHGICPDCVREFYPEISERDR